MKLTDIITKEVWAKLWAYVLTGVTKAKALPSWAMFFLNYIGQLIYSFIKGYFDKKEAQKKSEEKQKAEQNLNEKLNDEKASVEDVGKAYEDFINSGRK